MPTLKKIITIEEIEKKLTEEAYYYVAIAHLLNRTSRGISYWSTKGKIYEGERYFLRREKIDRAWFVRTKDLIKFLKDTSGYDEGGNWGKS